MKKYIFPILIFFFTTGVGITHNDAAWAISIESMSTEYSSASSGGPITIYTSEMVPGAQCTCEQGGEMGAGGMGPPTESISTAGTCPLSVPIEKRKYKCTVQPGLGSFQRMFAAIIKYFVNIVLLFGVLAIVGLGIAWSWAGGDDVKVKGSLKKWGINIVVGLAILFLFQYILRFLAPWIYQ